MDASVLDGSVNDATVPVPGSLALCSGLPEAVAKRWLAFDSDREAYNRDLYLIKADGSGLKRLTMDASTELDPAFAPDGMHLAYASDKGGSMQIYVLDLSAGTSKPITQISAGADQPSWSADGKQIVFHTAASVYIMDADGGNAHEIGHGLDNFNAYKYPSLSPDGKVVVFDRNNEIDAMGIDGMNFRYIVQNWTTTEEMPAISPDGYNVAYSVKCYSGEQIAVVSFAGYASDPCMVTFATPTTLGTTRRPAWGPSNFIAFEHADTLDGGTQMSEIAITAGPGQTPCVIADGPYQSHNPAWAPDGFQP